MDYLAHGPDLGDEDARSPLRHSLSSLLDGDGEFWSAGAVAGETSGPRRQSFCIKSAHPQLWGREDRLWLHVGALGVGSLNERE